MGPALHLRCAVALDHLVALRGAMEQASACPKIIDMISGGWKYSTHIFQYFYGGTFVPISSYILITRKCLGISLVFLFPGR